MSIFIKDNGILKTKLDDILWLEAMGDYIKNTCTPAIGTLLNHAEKLGGR